MLKVKSQTSAIAPSERDFKNQGFGGAKPNQCCELCELHDADKKLGKGINASACRTKKREPGRIGEGLKWSSLSRKGAEKGGGVGAQICADAVHISDHGGVCCSTSIHPRRPQSHHRHSRDQCLLIMTMG